MKVRSREAISRGRFLRRTGAGAFGLAMAAAGDLIAAPVAGAKGVQSVDRRRTYAFAKDMPDSCTGIVTCTRCNGCCGSPCQPYGVAYCYHCISDGCGPSYYACYSNEPDKFTICCH